MIYVNSEAILNNDLFLSPYIVGSYPQRLLTISKLITLMILMSNPSHLISGLNVPIYIKFLYVILVVLHRNIYMNIAC